MSIESELARIGDKLEQLLEKIGVAIPLEEQKPEQPPARKKGGRKKAARAEESEEVSVEKLREALTKVQSKEGRDTAVAVLEHFGASAVKKLKNAHYADAIELAQRVLKEGPEVLENGEEEEEDEL